MYGFLFSNQVLLEALSRCVGVLTASSKHDDMAVLVNDPLLTCRDIPFQR